MTKRQLIINGYKTAEHGLWTMASCIITKATQEKSFVSVPGRYSPLDLTTALTDGEPYYGNATLKAVLESSEGTRAERQERIEHMINLLDGYNVTIIHPDHPQRYLVGRITVEKDYNDPVHCAVKITATCEPWFYNAEETVIAVEAKSTEQIVELVNSGRLAMTPKVVVHDEALIAYGAYSKALNEGTYYLPDLFLTPGTHEVVVSGSGIVSFTYREAVLAE